MDRKNEGSMIRKNEGSTNRKNEGSENRKKESKNERQRLYEMLRYIRQESEVWFSQERGRESITRDEARMETCILDDGSRESIVTTRHQNNAIVFDEAMESRLHRGCVLLSSTAIPFK